MWNMLFINCPRSMVSYKVGWLQHHQVFMVILVARIFENNRQILIKTLFLHISIFS
jgi:hypothetical protein